MAVTFQKVRESENEIRLDRWFKRHFPALTHGALEKLLRKKNIRVNHLKAASNQRLKTGDEIRIPPLDVSLPAKTAAKKLSKSDVIFIQSLVLYKDDEVIILNKPAGLAVQGGTKTSKHVDGLLDGLTFDYVERPKLVHRLDKETSGVLMIARTQLAATQYTKLFRSKDIQKIYWALVSGSPKIKEGKIDAPLIKKAGTSGERMVVDFDQGDKAISLYTTIDNLSNKVSWIELSPLTGRTHQLRVHCADILKTPIIGDDKYGRRSTIAKKLTDRMFLHAHSISWQNKKGEMLTVVAPLPEYFRQAFRDFGFNEKLNTHTLMQPKRRNI